MQIKKQLWGYNLQEVEIFLAGQEKKEADELQKINTRMAECQQKSQQRITELAILLQRFESYQEQEHEIMEQLLEQVRTLAEGRHQAEQYKHAAQKDFHLKLEELSDAYRLIDDIKAQLDASYKQVSHFSHRKNLRDTKPESFRKEWYNGF